MRGAPYGKLRPNPKKSSAMEKRIPKGTVRHHLEQHDRRIKNEIQFDSRKQEGTS
jgi:hypothetical protein